MNKEELVGSSNNNEDNILIDSTRNVSSNHDPTSSGEVVSAAAITTSKQEEHENSTSNNASNHVIIGEEKKKEAPWLEIWNDSVELENLVFSIHRSSARNRMLQLIGGLKLLSEKLKRLDEVQHYLIEKRKNQAKDVLTQTHQSEKSLQLQRNHTTNTRKRAFSLLGVSQITATGSNTILSNGKNDLALEHSNMASPNNRQKVSVLEQKDQSLPTLSVKNKSTSHAREVVENCSSGNSNEKSLALIGEDVVDLAAPPVLKSKDIWVQHHANKVRCKISNQPLANKYGAVNMGQFCPDFEVDHTCPLGCSCTRWHIYNPPHTIKQISFKKNDLDLVYSKYRSVILKNSDFTEKIKPDGFNRQRYACGFICPLDQTIYYSNGIGSKSSKNPQNIWWYFTMGEARNAVSTIVVKHLIERGIVPKTFRSKKKKISDLPKVETKRAIAAKEAVLATTVTSSSQHSSITAQPLPSTLPLIHPWNWMEIHYKHGRCVNYNSLKGCTNGRSCPLSHVHFPKSLPSTPPSNISLAHLVSQGYYNYFQFRAACLEHVHTQKLPSLRIRSAIDDKNQTWYTAAWHCPVEHIFYYAAGGDGRIQTIQNIFLYSSKEAAKDATWNIILQAWRIRGLKNINVTESRPPSVYPNHSLFQDSKGMQIEPNQLNQKGKLDAETFTYLNQPVVSETNKSIKEIKSFHLKKMAVSKTALLTDLVTEKIVPHENTKPTNNSDKKVLECLYNEEDIDIEDELFGEEISNE